MILAGIINQSKEQLAMHSRKTSNCMLCGGGGGGVGCGGHITQSYLWFDIYLASDAFKFANYHIKLFIYL